MPQVLLAVSDTESSIYRPAVLSVVEAVQKQTGIPTSIKCEFAGETEKDYQAGSTLDGDENTNKFHGPARIKIVADEVASEDLALSVAVYQPNNLFVFVDKSLDVYMKPVYRRYEVTINFMYRGIDKIDVTRWRDEVQARVSAMRDRLIHDLIYSWQPPEELWYIIEGIHELREEVAGYGQDLDTYIRTHSTNMLTQLVDRAGNNPEWTIAETQSDVQGFFDFSAEPEKIEKTDELPNHEVSFSYKFYYDKPFAVILQYPVIIHNQILDKKYRPTLQETNPKPKKRMGAKDSESLFNITRVGLFEIKKAQHGIRIPENDEFLPPPLTIPSAPLYTALCQITETDKRTLMNLVSDVGNIQFNDSVLTFLKSEYSYITTDYSSVFQLILFENFVAKPGSYLSVDSSLNVVASQDLNLRKTYRLRLGIVTSLKMLSDAALERLRLSGVAGFEIIKAINPNITSFPDLVYGLYCSKSDFNKLVLDASNINSGDLTMKTVMTMSVKASRS